MAKKSEILKQLPQINTIIASIRKKFGDNSVLWFGESVKTFDNYDVMESGLFGLDNILGNHGLVKGRFIEIFGPESSGKTTLMLHIVKQAQKLGGVCAYIDAEHALDPIYARNMGVDLDSLLISQPDSAEESLQICEQLCGAGCIDFVILDSIGGLLTKEEMEKTAEDSSVASLAKILTPSIKRISTLISNTKTIFCAINQERDKIQMGWGGGGGGSTTPGGRAVKFTATYRLQIRRTGQVKRGSEIIGITSSIKAIKNKASAPFKETEVEILFSPDNEVYGIWESSDIYSISEQLGILEGKTVKSFNGTRLGNGQFDSKLAIHENKELRDAIVAKVRSIIGYNKTPAKFREGLTYIEPVVTKKTKPKPAKEMTEEEAMMAELAALQGSGVDISSLLGNKPEAPTPEEQTPEAPTPEEQTPEESEEEPRVIEQPSVPDLSRFLPQDESNE